MAQAAETKAEAVFVGNDLGKKEQFIKNLRQYPDVERLVMAIEGGFITADGTSTIAATDVVSIAAADPDERAQSIAALLS